MNIQKLCCKFQSISLLIVGKPNTCTYQLARRLLHVSAPRLAPTPNTPTPSPTPVPTTSTDLFRQTLKEVKEKAPQKKAKGKKDEPGVRRARCTIERIKGSPYKMALILNQIRGLSYQEAVAQMTFSKKKMAIFVKRAIDSARYNAENIHNMNPDRLIVEDCWTAKSKYLRRLRIHAKGRTGIMHHPFCKVFVVLREVPPMQNEYRLGRFGRTTRTIRKQMGLEEDAKDVAVVKDA